MIGYLLSKTKQVMVKFKKYYVNPPHVPRKFKAFKKAARNIGHLKKIIRTNQTLRKVVKGIFSKTSLKITAVGGVVGTGAYYLNKYIQSNSGCFMKSGSSICKVKELSCCQKDKLANVPFCPKMFPEHTCNDFDENKENSCCRLCDCQSYRCLPHQSMECRRPTVDEALAYYAERAADAFWNIIKSLFPYLYWFLGILAVGVGIIFLLSIYQKTR